MAIIGYEGLNHEHSQTSQLSSIVEHNARQLNRYEHCIPPCAECRCLLPRRFGHINSTPNNHCAFYSVVSIHSRQSIRRALWRVSSSLVWGVRVLRRHH
jgi:hypothetical protein